VHHVARGAPEVVGSPPQSYAPERVDDLLAKRHESALRIPPAPGARALDGKVAGDSLAFASASEDVVVALDLRGIERRDRGRVELDAGELARRRQRRCRTLSCRGWLRSGQNGEVRNHGVVLLGELCVTGLVETRLAVRIFLGRLHCLVDHGLTV